MSFSVRRKAYDSLRLSTRRSSAAPNTYDSLRHSKSSSDAPQSPLAYDSSRIPSDSSALPQSVRLLDWPQTQYSTGCTQCQHQDPSNPPATPQHITNWLLGRTKTSEAPLSDSKRTTASDFPRVLLPQPKANQRMTAHESPMIRPSCPIVFGSSTCIARKQYNVRFAQILSSHRPDPLASALQSV